MEWGLIMRILKENKTKRNKIEKDNILLMSLELNTNCPYKVTINFNQLWDNCDQFSVSFWEDRSLNKSLFRIHEIEESIERIKVLSKDNIEDIKYFINEVSKAMAKKNESIYGLKIGGQI